MATPTVNEYYQGMPQLDPAFMPNLIFWLVVTMVVLYVILDRVAIPRIGGTIEDRHEVISNDLEAAADLNRKAEEAEATYHKALALATVGDFEAADRISLSNIDANGAAPGNAAFTWLGTPGFTGAAGELRFSVFGSNTIVQADVNGDGAADMEILLRGYTALDVSDFNL